MKPKIRILLYPNKWEHKGGIPKTFRNQLKRYLFIKEERRKSESNYLQEKRFGFQHRGSYKGKRCGRVMITFHSLSFDTFFRNKDKYLKRLVSIEKYLNYFYTKALKYEGCVIETGENYASYDSWSDIFGTLSYISDRWNCANRLSWLIDLIKKYKSSELDYLLRN